MTRTIPLALIGAVFGLALAIPGVADAHRVARHVHVDVVRVLPAGHHRIVHRGVHYAYHAGRYYVQRHGHWVVVRPPVGIAVPVLPRRVDVVIRGVHRHYRHDGVEYRRTARGYVVVHR